MMNLKEKNPRIAVIGDLILDKYLWGSCSRISPEAPVQVIDIDQETFSLGGAGNVVKNLHALGAKIYLLSVLGDCDVADQIKGHLAELGNSLKQEIFIEKKKQSSIKTRLIASQQQVIRYDRECKKDISKESEEKIFNYFCKNIANFDAVILSDYDKGVLTGGLVQKLITFANKHKIKVLIDPKGSNFNKYSGAYLITPNKKEASISSGIEISDNKTLLNNLEFQKNNLNISVPLITLSEQGIAILNDKLDIFPATIRNVFDVTGAGDTVISALSFCIASGYDINFAVKFANLAAGVVVGKIGSATASIDEIVEYELKLNKTSSSQNLCSIDQIESISISLKQDKKSIVFTNGCFDILHSGHVTYLEKAKNFGDCLIVGINSNNSVKKLKGEKRPINDESTRAQIIGALKCVDYVVIFEDETPLNLIKKIAPHTLVKGGDYNINDIVGKEYATQVRLVDFVNGHSTSKTIEKIISLNKGN